MKKTLFIILIWVVGFIGAAYLTASCSDVKSQKPPTEQTTQNVDSKQSDVPYPEEPQPDISKKTGKVIASFTAYGVWFFHYSAYSPCVTSVPFAYLLIDNGDVIIVNPSTPYTHKNAVCTPPFTKEEAKIILEAQLGKQPSIVYY